MNIRSLVSRKDSKIKFSENFNCVNLVQHSPKQYGAFDGCSPEFASTGPKPTKLSSRIPASSNETAIKLVRNDAFLRNKRPFLTQTIEYSTTMKLTSALLAISMASVALASKQEERAVRTGGRALGKGKGGIPSAQQNGLTVIQSGRFRFCDGQRRDVVQRGLNRLQN